jgi:hypothetical protein
MVAELNRKVGITMTTAAAAQTPTQSPMGVPPEKAERDGFLIVALGVSILIAIFAVVMQVLVAADAISLSTTQQLMIWFAAVGLIALFWIAYMAIKAQAQLVETVRATAREQVAQAEAKQAAAEREATTVRATAQEQVAQAQAKQADAEREAAALRGRDDSAAGAKSEAVTAQSQDAWVLPGKFRRVEGSKQSVNTADVFPDGCLLEKICEAQIYDEETKTNRRAYRCEVVDLNRELQDRLHDAVVTILADQVPSLPPKARHRLVEFDGLTIMSRVTDRSPIRMEHELRAKGIRLVRGQG